MFLFFFTTGGECCSKTSHVTHVTVGHFTLSIIEMIASSRGGGGLNHGSNIFSPAQIL